ncbi:MAG TPA: hypothetical protein VHC69_27870 [Polyangiaceae bacterium]|nr:hypothetical protein [Polyangiaceae bacterium]
MAEQAISKSGVVYARGGAVAARASRPLGAVGGYGASGGFIRRGALRALSQAISMYVDDSIVSLLNLRLLSRPLAHYTPSTLVRLSPTRLISSVYVAPVPPSPVPPVDDTLPVVGNFEPAPGTPIARMAPVSFDVTDDSGELRLIFIVAFFPSTGVTEVVHDGASFRGFYSARSSRMMIAGGFRYVVLRSGGWPAAPTIQTFALDRAGNEAS